MHSYFPSPTGLHTDLYQLTMAYGYWQSGLYRRKACFHLFYRKPPFDGSYVITAGLEAAIDFIRQFRFSVEDIQYLAGLKGSAGRPLFDESFLNHLQRMKFSCSIEALPEGTIAYPFTPLLRLEGPIIQAQLLETGLLNLINFPSLIATKSARIVQAAQGDPVLEFGYRRAQGPDGALSASRAAYIGGCHATSNVLAGRAFDIPVRGTHAHSWVMCFGEEKEAFLTYARSQPDNCIFLVDTYDTYSGIQNAIEAGRWLREQGHEMNGIRLDSGDLGELSQAARQMLDQAGFPDAKIVASNDLDEYRIKELKERGAKVQVWGVGTRLATAYEQPALGGVYKLSALTDERGNWMPRIKLSEEKIKISTPGRLSVNRYFHPNGQPAGDLVYDIDLKADSRQMIPYNHDKVVNFGGMIEKPLMQTIFHEGKLVYDLPSAADIRERSLQEQEQERRTTDYPYGLELRLHQKREQMIREAGEKVALH